MILATPLAGLAKIIKQFECSAAASWRVRALEAPIWGGSRPSCLRLFWSISNAVLCSCTSSAILVQFGVDFARSAVIVLLRRTGGLFYPVKLSTHRSSPRNLRHSGPWACGQRVRTYLFIIFGSLWQRGDLEGMVHVFLPLYMAISGQSWPE